MSVNKLYDETKRKMDKAVDVLVSEISKLRTSRATPAMLDGIRVDYYGTPTPINQLATITVPESRQLVIQPWDVSQIASIEKAILSSDVGLTPINDGKIIRIQVPILTEERRKELVKVARRYAEECRVAIRNLRRDANESIKKLEKEKEISQDEENKAQDHIQDVTDREIKNVDRILEKKEKDIMEI